MIRSLYTHFEAQAISYLDFASCARIVTVSARPISDHHESGLSRAVYIGRIAIKHLCMHQCALFRSTRLSRLKSQCFPIWKLRCDRDGLNNDMESLFSVE